MSPFYELNVDQRGHVVPKSEKRLDPGDTVTLIEKLDAEGKEVEYFVSVMIESDDKAVAAVFDGRTPAEVSGFTIKEGGKVVIAPGEQLDGFLRMRPVGKKGVYVQEHIGAGGLEPKKAVRWKKSPKRRSRLQKMGLKIIPRKKE